MTTRDHSLQRHVRNHATSFGDRVSPDVEDKAVALAESWYAAADRLGVTRADVDATGGSLIDIAVRAALMAGPTPPMTPAPRVELPARIATSKIIWFTTKQAGEHVGLHPTTVSKACESGELHGSQRVAGGRWRIHVDCLEAWAAGAPCPHAGQAQR